MIKQLFKSKSALICFLSIVATAGWADDADIYFADSTALIDAGIRPNVLLVIDTSGSMKSNSVSDGEGGSITRWQAVINAVRNILNNTDLEDKVNIGLVRFNRSGGAVVYPISKLGVDNGIDYKARLLTEFNSLDAESGTPIVGSLYESALYFTGGEVDNGVDRRKTAYSTPNPLPPPSRYTPSTPYYLDTTSESESYRVSHPDSIAGSAVPSPGGCISTNSLGCASEKYATASLPLTYISPITEACQANHMVLLTDGDATELFNDDGMASLIGKPVSSCDRAGTDEACAVDLAKYLAETDLVTGPGFDGDQTVTTHTIAFVDGSPALLGEIAAAGGGTYQATFNSEELEDAFLKIINDAVTVAPSNSATPVATVSAFNSLSHRNELYLSMFEPSTTKRWPGNIKKYQLKTIAGEINVLADASGAAAIDSSTGFFRDTSRDLFDAAISRTTFNVTDGGVVSQITSKPMTFTYFTDTTDSAPGAALITSGSKVIVHEDRLPGGASSDTNLTKILDEQGITTISADRQEFVKWVRGFDTQNVDEDADGDTTDVRQQIGDAMHSFPSVASYNSSSEAALDEAILFGTNDGYFHSVDAETGDIIWSFVPEELFNIMPDLKNNMSGNHVYGVDGSPWVRHNDVDNDGVIEPGDGDFIHVYFGMRRGGKTYYALDITNKSTPQLLWKITGGIAGSDFEKLAQTWSQPVHTVVGISDGTVDADGNAGVTAKHVIFFAGGYDIDQDTNTTRTADSEGNALYMIDASTGALLWRADVAAGFTDMIYSMPSRVAIADTTRSSFTNQIYIGDMGGQVWRFDVNTGSQTEAQLLADSDNDFITGQVVASLANTGTANNRRFYQPPDLGIVKAGGTDYIAVAIGSGWRANPNDEVVDDRFYLLRIPNPYVPLGTFTALTESPTVLTDITDDTNLTAVAAAANGSGWLINMVEDGEKVLSRALIFQGRVHFASYTPEDRLIGCEPVAGTSRGYVVSITDGERVFASQFFTLAAAGIIDSPALFLTGDQTDENDNVTLGGGSTYFGTEKVGDDFDRSLIKRTFWYEED